MDPYAGHDDPDASSASTFLRDDLPGAINWNLLLAEEADYEWHDLDHWVKWLKSSHGLSPSIIPPFYYLHDELVWELSALHTHWLCCYHQTAPASAPIVWRRDFEDAKRRLRDWVAISGTRLDRDRPTRVTPWPGETPVVQSAEITIQDRDGHFEEFVRQDVQRRRRIEATVNNPLAG